MFHVVFYEPRIPGNTGSAIRMAAATGSLLHLVEPLGFEMSDAKLKRAGLDYHDLARVMVHPNFETVIAYLNDNGSGLIYAYTGHTTTSFDTIAYAEGDALLFGPEPDGLPAHILEDARITQRVRIPMFPGIRSLNLSNSASLGVYEAWRQHGYAGAGQAGAAAPPTEAGSGTI